MFEELICICGHNIFKISKGRKYVICSGCNKISLAADLAEAMRERENKEVEEQEKRELEFDRKNKIY